jgi:Cu2+-containing amine oxidase
VCWAWVAQGQRAQFIYAPLWVTPKAADGSDFWPSGDFMNCNGGGEGAPRHRSPRAAL